MELCDLKWKEFFLDEIFSEIKRGKRLKRSDHISGDTPYVSSSALNNGVDAFVGNEKKVRKYKDCLSLANSGSVGSCFYEPFEFVASDHVTHLKGNYTQEQYLFMANMLNRLSEKYNFNREINDERITREKIMLPVDSEGNPDFVVMESIIKSIKVRKYQDYKIYIDKQVEKLEFKDIEKLSVKKWDKFYIDDIFKIESGKRLESYNMVTGTRPFIGATEFNNGITNYISNTNASLDKNVLGVNYNGNVVINFYHPYECIFSDDVKRFHLKHYPDNKYILLFFKTIILQQKPKYSYGYKFNGKRMKRQIIMLPVNDVGEPDYEYMEQYIKNLMIRKYKDYIQYNTK